MWKSESEECEKIMGMEEKKEGNCVCKLPLEKVFAVCRVKAV